jgi:antitoxin VapB
MGINIKNEQSVRLIRELAELAGEGQTEAVTVAVRERINRLRADTEAAKRIEAMTEVASRMAPVMRGLDWDEVLYGENGLYDRQTGLPK